MKAMGHCFGVLLLGWLTVGCNNPNVSRQPVPPADKLQAADCQVAQRELERRLQLPRRASVVVRGRSESVRTPAEQSQEAERFARRCTQELTGHARRIILRCWLDAPDAESFLSCNERF